VAHGCRLCVCRHGLSACGGGLFSRCPPAPPACAMLAPAPVSAAVLYYSVQHTHSAGDSHTAGVAVAPVQRTLQRHDLLGCPSRVPATVCGRGTPQRQLHEPVQWALCARWSGCLSRAAAAAALLRLLSLQRSQGCPRLAGAVPASAEVHALVPSSSMTELLPSLARRAGQPQ
jgi:hypothetical protein